MIVNDHVYDGILFIGDPHTGSRRPGRRKDNNFIEVSTGKLDQSLIFARTHNYLPVILGDLIDREKDNNIYFIARLLEVLSKSKDAICPLGNHDKSEVETYSDGDTINIIDKANVINIIKEPMAAGVFNVHSFDDNADIRVGIYVVPYGFKIPDDISGEFEEKVDHVFMITHHDLAFDPVFAHIDMKEINGCDMVVNGHLHMTFPHQDFGNTRWFNPGNILRISATEKDNEPSVWSWSGGTVLDRYKLEYEKDIFDLTGYNVVAAEELPMDHHSIFVDILKAETNMEANASEDGSLLTEDINRIIDESENEVTEEVLTIVRSLHKKAVATLNDESEAELIDVKIGIEG